MGWSFTVKRTDIGDVKYIYTYRNYLKEDLDAEVNFNHLPLPHSIVDNWKFQQQSSVSSHALMSSAMVESSARVGRTAKLHLS